MTVVLSKLKQPWHALEKRWMPAYVWETDPFTLWQERILFILCFFATAFGPLVLIPSILLSVSEGLPSVAILDLAAYLGVVTVLVIRQASLEIRAGLIFLILFFLGLGLMIILGPVGAGYLWLLAASIIVSTVYDLKAAFYSLACNATAMLAIAVFIGNGTLDWNVLSDNPLEQWLVMTGNFLFINVMISTTTALMLHSLKKNFETTRLAMDELQQSQARLYAVFDAVESIPIQGYDKNRQVIFWNTASEQVYGYTRHQALGKKLENLIVLPDMQAQVVRDITAWIDRGIPIPAGEITLQNSRGEPVPVFSSHIMITNHQGEKEMFCVDLDLTSFKQVQAENAHMEAQYRQAQKMESIGRLAGGVAHDLNNLLSPILGYSDLLFEDPRLADSHKESLAIIQRAGFRARDLVRQLLAFSRKQTLSVKPVDLNRAVKRFEPLLKRTIRENIRITTALSADPGVVVADIGQIEQVIMNLAVNAADAMPDGGCITIETAFRQLDETDAQLRQGVTPGRYVVLAVSDTGAGMDKETCEKIFEPFFSTKGDHGTGLGLATVYGIVKQHGGNVWVYSEPEKGTTFRIYLPAAAGHGNEESPRAEHRDDRARGTETILVVEDDELVRQLVCTILEKNGYQVIAADGGRKALQMADTTEGPIRLMLTDVVMPDLNGKDLYLKIHKIHPDIKVLYMTGYTSNVIAHHGILEQGVQFIQKPFSVTELTARIRQVLDTA